MKVQFAAIFCLCLTGAACVADDAPPPDGCGAAELQGLVGQPQSVLETMRFSQDLRVIPPGTAVTMDYREDRLNIDLDEAGQITRVWCG